MLAITCILFLSLTLSLAGDSRVVGGHDAVPGEVRWQASLGVHLPGGASNPSFHVCGGVVLGGEWVLTTARCCRGGVPELLHVIAGMTDISSIDEPDRQVMSVAETITHESFDPTTLDNDICLVRADSAFAETASVGSIPLALATPDEGAAVSVSGWGIKSEIGIIMSMQLQVADLLIHDHDLCAGLYAENEIRVTANMVCAYRQRLLAGAVDACEGDGGGPLFANNGTHQELVGLVSWGLGCGRRDQPGVYTDVTKYREWIEQKTSSSRIEA